MHRRLSISHAENAVVRKPTAGEVSAWQPRLMAALLIFTPSAPRSPGAGAVERAMIGADRERRAGHPAASSRGAAIDRVCCLAKSSVMSTINAE